MSAFADIRVLDCAQGIAGPVAAMFLADYGAQVLKIEPPGGDRAKASAGYIGWNRNKRRLTLDLAADNDRRRLERLLDGADVAIFDQGPGELARLGFEPATLTADRPHLIPLWVPPYGTRGRWSDLPACHAILTGLTGTAFRQASYADQPVWLVTPLVHYAQAVIAASAAAAALYQRAKGARPSAVTVSGLHAMAETHCPVAFVGAPASLPGNPLGTSPSHQLYQCADGRWLFLGCLMPPFVRKALAALDLEGHDPTEIPAAIHEALAAKPRDHWLAFFREREIPVGPADRREDWPKSEIAVANDLFATLRHPTLGAVMAPAPAARLIGTPGLARHLATEADDATLQAFATPREATCVADPPAPGRGPLAGVRVLDLGTLIAGPHAATILANFGADVVKIEPAEGDPLRPSKGLFINYNRGKRALGLDLKHPEGRALFLDLVRQADVVLDNFRLGVRERLGIDHATLRAANPRLISCSANTYGSKGPDARQPGFDTVLQARSGLMAAQGGADEPVYHAIPVNDVATAALTAFAIAVALDARETTGQGQAIETSLAAAASLYQFGELTSFVGRRPDPEGGRDCLGVSALQRYFRCADGWLAIACDQPDQFAALAGALGRAQWTQRWSSAEALEAARDGPLALAIAAAIEGRARDELVERLTAAGVPAAPVLRDQEAHQDAFLAQNGYYQRHFDARLGELIASRGFADFDGAPASFDRLYPDLGGDAAEVLADYGVAPDRIAALVEAGVIVKARPDG